MADSATLPSTTMKKRRSLVRELLQTVVLAAIIFLGVRAALQNFRVEGDSMWPTLHDNEYVLVNKVDYMLYSPSRGDIVVFRAVPALLPDRDFIKRIIGLPGETVAVRNGGVYINNRRLREPYIHEPPAYVFAQRRVPQNDYFVLGDDRNNSFDSAKWTTTPWLERRYIIGKAWIAYWPLSAFGFLSTLFNH
jgi:signal peptidase I